MDKTGELSPEGSTPQTIQTELAVANPMAWFDRITIASRQLNYVGVFSYQTGWRTETSRIVHRFANGEEKEHLEILDGSPREIIREGDNMRCVLPAQRTIIVGKMGIRNSFPGYLPQNHAELTANYRIHLEGVGRIAGLDAQKLVLEPRDELRYGHMLWVELQSGLLLKSQVIDANGKVIEQFAFSDVRIGGEINDELLTPSVKTSDDWHTVDVSGDHTARIENQWALSEPLPGFTRLATTQHRTGWPLQLVYSDGLAAISIFIEPAEAGINARGYFAGGGAVNVFERILNGYRITALGEAPASLVQRAAESIKELK
jgi:sigma-E factor negative regulatory protein RseB